MDKETHSKLFEKYQYDLNVMLNRNQKKVEARTLAPVDTYKVLCLLSNFSCYINDSSGQSDSYSRSRINSV